MKNSRIGAVTVGVVVLASVGIGWTSAAQKPGRALIASGHPDWPPIMFKDGDVISGAAPALVKQIFDDLGVTSTFPYSGAWDAAQAKARNGDVDVLVAAYKTKEREAYWAYSDAFTTDPLVVFVKKGKEFPFTKNDDLVGKKGVGTVGDSYGQAFDDLTKSRLTFERAATNKEGFDRVANGTADYFVYSLYSGQEEMKAENRSSQLSILPHVITEEPFYMIISKTSPFLHYLPDVNRLIHKYTADGTVAKLIAKYNTAYYQDRNHIVVPRGRD